MHEQLGSSVRLRILAVSWPTRKSYIRQHHAANVARGSSKNGIGQLRNGIAVVFK